MKALRKGDKGKQVINWQYFLIGQGYKLIADGDFGNKTDLATKDFQKKHKLFVDGVVGNQSYTKAMQLGFFLVEDPQDKEKLGPNWPPTPNFKPLTASQMQSMFGKIEFTVLANGSSVNITNGFRKDNIVTIELPQVKKLPPYNTNRISVHKKAASQFQQLFTDWKKAGLTDRILTYDGAFNARLIRGSSKTLSSHAYGIAIDLNAKWNALGVNPANVGEKGSIRELVTIANKLGFYWGGHFSRKDGMHFELAKIL